MNFYLLVYYWYVVLHYVLFIVHYWHVILTITVVAITRALYIYICTLLICYITDTYNFLLLNQEVLEELGSNDDLNSPNQEVLEEDEPSRLVWKCSCPWINLIPCALRRRRQLYGGPGERGFAAPSRNKNDNNMYSRRCSTDLKKIYRIFCLDLWRCKALRMVWIKFPFNIILFNLYIIHWSVHIIRYYWYIIYCTKS